MALSDIEGVAEAPWLGDGVAETPGTQRTLEAFQMKPAAQAHCDWPMAMLVMLKEVASVPQGVHAAAEPTLKVCAGQGAQGVSELDVQSSGCAKVPAWHAAVTTSLQAVQGSAPVAALKVVPLTQGVGAHVRATGSHENCGEHVHSGWPVIVLVWSYAGEVSQGVQAEAPAAAEKVSAGQSVQTMSAVVVHGDCWNCPAGQEELEQAWQGLAPEIDQLTPRVHRRLQAVPDHAYPAAQVHEDWPASVPFP